MIHYVCTGGCNGVSNEAKTCDTADCPKYESPLTECNCTDENHKEAYEKDKEDNIK